MDKIVLFVAKFIFVIAEMNFKVVVMAPVVVKITFVVTFSGAHIRLFVVKITFVAAEIIFKVDVITFSVAKINL